MPASTVIPVLAYPSVAEAVAWLSAAFGFTLRLGIGDHRAQLNAGDGAIVVIGGAPPGETHGRDSIMVRVDDADAHCERARAASAIDRVQQLARQRTLAPTCAGQPRRRLADARRSSTLTTGVVCVRAVDPFGAGGPAVALAPVSQ